MTATPSVLASCLTIPLHLFPGSDLSTAAYPAIPLGFSVVHCKRWATELEQSCDRRCDNSCDKLRNVTD